MDGIREWAFSVCAVSVIGAAVSLLVPDNRSEKLMNMCISVLVLLVAVTPLADIKSCTVPDIAPQEEQSMQSGELGVCIDEQIAKYLSDTARKLVAARLAEEGIIPKEISVVMDSSENGSISIGQVTVVIDTADTADTQSVRLLVSQWLGTENVDVTGGSNE